MKGVIFEPVEGREKGKTCFKIECKDTKYF